MTLRKSLIIVGFILFIVGVVWAFTLPRGTA